MDILAHGLWTNAAFETTARVKKQKRSKKDTWTAIFFGIAPDLFSFGIFFLTTLSSKIAVLPYATGRVSEEIEKVAVKTTLLTPKLGVKLDHLSGRLSDVFPGSPPDPSEIPNYVHIAYNLTHSLVIFLGIFLIIWLIRKKPYWLMAGWGFHILIDIFSHTEKFFATPFLFPISDFKISVVSWANPVFMTANYFFLLLAYIILYVVPKIRRKKLDRPQIE